MHLTSFIPLLLAVAHGSPTAASDPSYEPEGLVDLGYAKHVPTSIDTTPSGLRVTVYRNIRFAKSTTGNLRFRGPDTDLPRVDEVQDGKLPLQSKDCISSAPGFVPFPDINGTTWGVEDCLFLDVYIPEGVKPGDKVPVLHNFPGSAYAFGSKDMFFSPIGLYETMHKQNKSKFIAVVNNYRMGVSGFTWADGEDLDANVGMLDNLAAAGWTAKHIHKFGGDKDRVTVLGQSAGGGIIYFLSVLDGGEGKPPPFQQAFISSPCAPQRRDVKSRQRKLFDLVLHSANCTTLACLRSLPESAIVRLNDLLINQMPSEGGGGTLGPVIGFGPIPDGKRIPDIPSALIKQGQMHKGFKKLILGSMAAEGNGLSNDEGMPERFPSVVRQLLPRASNATVKALMDAFYTPGLDKELAWDWLTDTVFSCNAYNLAKALPDKSMRYIMSTPPALHGLDLMHLLYFNQEVTPVPDPELAYAFQAKFLAFIQGEDVVWPKYGKHRRMYNITDTFEATTMPPKLRYRCDLLNRFVLDPANGA